VGERSLKYPSTITKKVFSGSVMSLFLSPLVVIGEARYASPLPKMANHIQERRFILGGGTLKIMEKQRENLENEMSEQLELPFDPPLDTPPKRAEILRTAEEYITKDRETEHGEMKDNFATIAVYWSIHLGVDVTTPDVAAMMALLKLARLKSSPDNLDNWVDACGYLACGGELACGDK